MADICPFQGVRYNPQRIQDLSKVVSPPYDVITPSEQQEYYQISPYNVIRLEYGKIFSKDDGLKNRYTRARRFLERWCGEGILIQDKEPSLYLYEQTFKRGRHRATRLGLVALLHLDGAGRCSVYPHERTLPLPKVDRYLLLKSLKANVSPLFFLYADREMRIEEMIKQWMRRTSSVAEARSGDQRHRLWRLTDPALIKEIRVRVCRNPLLIADGHHRYEVALALKQQLKTEQAHFVMAYFSNLWSPELCILPIHRVIQGMKEPFERIREKLSLFTWKPVRSLSQLLERVEHSQQTHTFGFSWEGKSLYLLSLKDRGILSQIDEAVSYSRTWRRLDVTVLHEGVLKRCLGFTEKKLRENLLYLRDPKACLEAIRHKHRHAAFFVKSPRIHEIRQIALSGERMPQKSTYFYPKPATGLVLYRFEDHEPL